MFICKNSLDNLLRSSMVQGKKSSINIKTQNMMVISLFKNAFTTAVSKT